MVFYLLMDLLSDILHEAGCRRRFLQLRHLERPRSLRFPCNKSIGFHVVSAGSIFVHAEGERRPLLLKAGDVALMARGCNHVLSTEDSFRPSEVSLLESFVGPAAASAETSSVVSGAYQFWNEPLHPFFAELPAWFVLRGDAQAKLAPMSLATALLAEETHAPKLGGERVQHALLDVIFTYLLRRIVEQEGSAGTSWSHAIHDAQIRRAVELMHGDCARAWTLDELARAVGLSRSALAEKFRRAMGDTPLSYLRTLRMQRAMRLLSETQETLESVAAKVGYRDAFSFSKVFKKTLGLAPRDFRRRDASEKASPWRL